jgi:hypothetical protein
VALYLLSVLGIVATRNNDGLRLVAFGSLSDFAALSGNARFTPNSDTKSGRIETFCAATKKGVYSRMPADMVPQGGPPPVGAVRIGV